MHMDQHPPSLTQPPKTSSETLPASFQPPSLSQTLERCHHDDDNHLSQQAHHDHHGHLDHDDHGDDHDDRKEW